MNTETNGLQTLDDLKKQHEDEGLEGFLGAYKEPFLMVSARGQSTALYPLPERSEEKRILLGQGADCNIRLAADGVEDCHLEFHYHNFLKEWCFADRGTDKGTVLDGEEIVPFAAYTLDESSDIALGEVSIKLWTVARVASLIFPEAVLPNEKTTTVPEGDATVDMSSRVLGAKPKSTTDPKRVKRFLKALTRGKTQPLTTLVIEARMLGRERFLEQYPEPILVLRRVVMVKGADPLYDFDSLPLSLRVYWPLDSKAETPLWEIGRQAECALQLQAKVISKVHAEVEYREQDWWIKDLGSVNGTYVDGRAIPSACAQRLPSKAKLSISQHISLLFLRSAALYNLLDGFSSDRL